MQVTVQLLRFLHDDFDALRRKVGKAWQADQSRNCKA